MKRIAKGVAQARATFIRNISLLIFLLLVPLTTAITFYPLFILGIAIAFLTMLGLGVQKSEAIRTQKEIDRQNKNALKEIEQAREDAAHQHTEAMREIAQAKQDATHQHAEAMREIAQARQDAVTQYAKAAQNIEKARDEAKAENIYLEAERFSTSILHKDALVNEAVALCPSLKQRAYRQLGLEMSAALIGNVDYIKYIYTKAAGYPFDLPYSEIPLSEEEKVFFTDHAIKYLQDTLQNETEEDAQAWLYLACVYGYCHQYDQMMSALDKTRQISPIKQVMKAEYRTRPMTLLLLAACSEDQTNIERLREVLQLPKCTKQFFCNYITREYPITENYRRGDFSKWAATRRPEAQKGTDTTVLSIAPPYPRLEGTAYASASCLGGRSQEIVGQDERVPIEELYQKLHDQFIMLCPLD